MKIKLLLLHFSFAFIWVIPLSKSQSQSQNLQREISKIIRFDTNIDFAQNHSLNISIIDEDSTYFLKFPFEKVYNDNFENEIFEIGGVSKLFTAQLIQSLAQDSIISYSDKINLFIPDQFKNPRLNNLSISDLINHNIKWLVLPYNFGKKNLNILQPFLYYTKSDLLKFYKDYIPEQFSFAYSHTNYALLELVIDGIASKNCGFECLLKQKIFDPIGLAHTYIQNYTKYNDIPTTGYNRANQNVDPWLYSTFAGSLGVKSTLADMSRWVKTFLDTHKAKTNKIDHHMFNNDAQPSFNEKIQIQNGWYVVKNNPYSIYMHSGKTAGHTCFVGMIKETKTAVVILSNSNINLEDLGFQLLRLINYNWKRTNL